MKINYGLFQYGHVPAKNRSQGTFEPGLVYPEAMRNAKPMFCTGCPYKGFGEVLGEGVRSAAKRIRDWLLNMPCKFRGWSSQRANPQPGQVGAAFSECEVAQCRHRCWDMDLDDFFLQESGFPP